MSFQIIKSGCDKNHHILFAGDFLLKSSKCRTKNRKQLLNLYHHSKNFGYRCIKMTMFNAQGTYLLFRKNYFISKKVIEKV